MAMIFCNRCGRLLEITGRPVLSDMEACYMVEVCPNCCGEGSHGEARTGAMDGHRQTRTDTDRHGWAGTE